MKNTIDLKELAHATALEVVKMLKKEKIVPDSQEHWITCKEAAAIIGVTPEHLRRIKDHFPHTKQGDNSQGQLRFLKEGLMKSYMNGFPVSGQN